MDKRILILAAAILAGCGPKRVSEEPILENGDRVPSAEVDAAQSDADRAAAADRFHSQLAEAIAHCVGTVCDALARGEIALGMTEAQVIAATRTGRAAWTVRSTGDAAVMVPASRHPAPRDAAGEVAMVQFRGGRVSFYSYTGAHGVRVVSTPADATTEGRASALAEQLIREGDDLTAAGDLDGALNRYDRASVLRPNDPLLDYRIATVLDKQLRPIEALVRYRLFLHRLELEKIEAVGDAYAKIAAAQVHARERIIVLEKHGR